MHTFGNLTVRTQNEQRAHERATWAAAGIQPRSCLKCAWLSDPAETSCPKCGVIFAKARASQDALPRTQTPLPSSADVMPNGLPRTTRSPFAPVPSSPEPMFLDDARSRDDDTYEPLAPETPIDAPYFWGELRVLSMLASLGTLALVVGAKGGAANELLGIAFVFQLIALMTWIGARAFEWGVRNGALGFIVLFFVTGWLWPLMAKPIAWIARLPASIAPRATSWIVAGVLVALSCTAAAVR